MPKTDTTNNVYVHVSVRYSKSAVPNSPIMQYSCPYDLKESEGGAILHT